MPEESFTTKEQQTECLSACVFDLSFCCWLRCSERSGLSAGAEESPMQKLPLLLPVM